MKVRYGKPIRAKSMLANSFSRDISNSGSYALVYKNWGTGTDVEFRAFTEADYSHKFFCYTEFELATNNFTHTGFAAQGTSESTYKPNNYSLCSINKPTANSVSLYVYGTLQNPITVKTRFMIDLTELGLDNLTAQEFYDRYKGKFGLLATGEEITLDRKVGQVSYDKKVILQSLWGDQSNLTAVQPSVSSNYIYLGKNGYSTQSTYNINTNLDDFNTPIINGHKYILILYQTGKSTYHMISTTNSDKWKWTSSGTYIAGKLTYSYYVADDDIILKNFYQGGSESPIIYKDAFIDLTDAFGAGNEPTATEFYNKYKGYFLSLTKGERVIVGKGKIAGGSSDIYYGYNQLCFPIKANLTGSGTTWAETANGFLTTSSSAGGNRGSVKNVLIINGHKYYIRATLTQSETGNCFITIYNSRYSVRFGDKPVALTSGVADSVEYIATSNFTDAGGIVCFYMNQNHTAQAGDTLLSEYVAVIDLTEWFGPGKEPSTVEEFREKFTKEYYGFCKTPIKLTRYQIEALPTYGYNQLVENGDFSNGVNKWYRTSTYTSLTNEDRIGVLTITSSGATTTQINLFTSNNNLQAIVGHKYFSSYTIKSNVNTAYEDQSFGGSRDFVSAAANSVDQNWSKRERILTATNTNGWQIYLAGNYSVGNKYYFKNIYIIDLTDWYGEGNEPTTVEEFKQSFPNKYYPYSKKRLLNKYMINKLVG